MKRLTSQINSPGLILGNVEFSISNVHSHIISYLFDILQYYAQMISIFNNILAVMVYWWIKAEIQIRSHIIDE